MRRTPAVIVLASGLAGCGGGPPAPPAPAAAPGAVAATPSPIHFTDVTAGSGLAMIMTCGGTPSRHILEVDGGGLGLIDYDHDGDLDVFVANGATIDDPEHGPGSRLFENLGGLKFRDVTEAAGITLTRWAMGVAIGDIDADGHDDIFVACYGANVMLRNLGDGRFEDVTGSAGLGDDRWATSAAFGDIDNDGDLDLYVVNYLEFDHANPPGRAAYKKVEVMSGPHGLPAQHDVLYENDGSGHFTDVTAAAGCRPAEPAFGLNVAIIDLDHDGQQDIFVGNDSMANFLFRRGADGRFADDGMISGVAANMDGGNQATMGIAIGDVDGNGWADLFTTNFSSDTNTLHLNLDGRYFEDRTQAYGLGMISRTYLGWTCGLFDFDHDGDEDLIAFNGHVYPEATLDVMDSEYEQPPLLFTREGRRFELASAGTAGAWLGRRYRHRTAAFGDLDGDGDIDVIAGQLNGPLQLLRNDATGSSWLTITLLDPRPGVGNRRGLGSRIDVRTFDGFHRRWIFSGGGFQSSSAAMAHLATSGVASTVEVEVTWPDGHTQVLERVQIGAPLEVRRD